MTLEDGVSLFQTLLRLQTLCWWGDWVVWQPVRQRQSIMDSKGQTFQPPSAARRSRSCFSSQSVSQLESLSALHYESPGELRKVAASARCLRLDSKNFLSPCIPLNEKLPRKQGRGDPRGRGEGEPGAALSPPPPRPALAWMCSAPGRAITPRRPRVPSGHGGNATGISDVTFSYQVITSLVLARLSSARCWAMRKGSGGHRPGALPAERGELSHRLAGHHRPHGVGAGPANGRVVPGAQISGTWDRSPVTCSSPPTCCAAPSSILQPVRHRAG